MQDLLQRWHDSTDAQAKLCVCVEDACPSHTLSHQVGSPGQSLL